MSPWVALLESAKLQMCSAAFLKASHDEPVSAKLNQDYGYRRQTKFSPKLGRNHNSPVTVDSPEMWLHWMMITDDDEQHRHGHGHSESRRTVLGDVVVLILDPTSFSIFPVNVNVPHKRGFCRRAAKPFGRGQLEVFEDAIEINTEFLCFGDGTSPWRVIDQFA